MQEFPAIAQDRTLIGKKGSRHAISTPALILDLDQVEANIEKMADIAGRNRVALRPHAKTHKSIALAKAQIGSGAIGICVSKLGEAEVFIPGGVEDVLVTSPIVSEASIRRLMTLRETSPKLKVTVSDISNAAALASAAADRGIVLDVLIDVDIGMRRTGTLPDISALDLAYAIKQAKSLRLVGLQAYAGHVMHVGAAETRRKDAHDALVLLADLRDRLHKEGFEIGIVSGSGTGTFDIDSKLDAFTELQVGSYVFMDAEYLAVEPQGPDWLFRPALFVDATVISNRRAGFVTTDAGYKAFATDGPLPAIVSGAPQGSTFFFMGDEQGGVLLPEGAETLPLGRRITCIVPHCDPNVNLYDHYHVVRGDELVGIWRIDARGRSS